MTKQHKSLFRANERSMGILADNKILDCHVGYCHPRNDKTAAYSGVCEDLEDKARCRKSIV